MPIGNCSCYRRATTWVAYRTSARVATAIHSGADPLAGGATGRLTVVTGQRSRRASRGTSTANAIDRTRPVGDGAACIAAAARAVTGPGLAAAARTCAVAAWAASITGVRAAATAAVHDACTGILATGISSAAIRAKALPGACSTATCIYAVGWCPRIACPCHAVVTATVDWAGCVCDGARRVRAAIPAITSPSLAAST